jgi:predicted NBD/HSP70 family sugar kinase
MKKAIGIDIGGTNIKAGDPMAEQVLYESGMILGESLVNFVLLFRICMCRLLGACVGLILQKSRNYGNSYY